MILGAVKYNHLTLLSISSSMSCGFENLCIMLLSCSQQPKCVEKYTTVRIILFEYFYAEGAMMTFTDKLTIARQDEISADCWYRR